jgi:septal ring factor EnvC (AmiA/AmiB activator)
MLRICSTIILTFFFVLGLDAQPQNEEEIEYKIKNIQARLQVIKGDLNIAYGKEREIIEQLEIHDQQINLYVNKITESKKEINSLQTNIDEVNSKIEQKSKQIETQKIQIINLLKLQVYLNHDKTLKMLLISPQNSNSDLIKHQLKYLQNRLYNLIKEVAIEIQSLQKLKQQQLSLVETEQSKQNILLQQQDVLVGQRKMRLAVLKQLKNEIAKHETETQTLNKDQARLQNLLNEIASLLSDLPSDLGSNKPFKQLKGKLSKPVSGEYIHSFNSLRSENTQWDGVVIQADIGTSVKSVGYGRVAYADWLRGFGMLVIIDHQDGYMSLYGFNQSINVDVGDWVDSEQEIASVGNSGTLATPALYFEIRKDAMPQNPRNWIK